MTFTILLLNYNLNGQCSLGCNGNIQVSLDLDDCEAEITSDMLLNGQTTSCPGAAGYTVDVMYNDEIIPTSPIVTSYYIGLTLTAKVTETGSGNSCWSTLSIEDKISPTIDCASPADPFLCYELENFLPTATDNCDGNVVLTQISEQTTINSCDGTFSDEVLKMVTRTYIAEDASGNVSDECTIDFTVIRIPDLTTVNRPSNFLLSDDTNLECDDDYPVDENGHPAPVSTALGGTGFPYFMDGTGAIIPLYPDVLVDCNLAASYTDLVLPPVGCAIKIMRTWTLNEWSCSDPQRSYVFTQMIEIVDSEGPAITCPNDMEVTTTLHECSAVFMLPQATVEDNCSTDNHVTTSYPTGFNDENGGLAELEVGDHVVVYTAYDECHNSSECEITVTVADKTPPVAVCDQNTTIAVTTDGTAWVNATVFDDGSTDECAVDRMLVRRMNNDNCECHYPIFTGYTYLGERNGHYYYLSDWASDFDLARKYSVALGGTLAVLSSGSEFSWVHTQAREYLEDGEEYWIGLERNSVLDDYRWVDGTALTYTNWGDNSNNTLNAHVLNSPGSADDAKWFNDPQESLKYVVEVSDICSYSEYTKFCCEDIGDDDQVVVFRVIDRAGNYNECMVNAEIQDKLPPAITCPDDMQVECYFAYDSDNLSQFFGEATAYDNCNVTMEEVAVEDLNQCNIGEITRTFTATDDGGRTASCYQVVSFVNSDPFNYDNDDIIWPADVTMEGCDDPTSVDYSPEETGKPDFLEDACDLVGADYDDQIFTFNNSNGDACFKIVRTWEVIDWCQFVELPGGGVSYPSWQHTQIIKVNNTVAPTITSSCEEKSVCTYDNQCENGYIELTATAEDDCTTDLKWYAHIDANNDGSFEVGLGVSGTGNTAVASASYPVGTHMVLWSFEDKCGNVTTCEQIFSVVNCKAPTPYCLNGLAVDLMPIDTDDDGVADEGMVELWASDFDNGSSHPCGYEVLLSFSPDVTETNMTFDCSHLGIQDVMIYASVETPEGELVQAFCNTYIDIQDNNGVCGDSGDADGKISGRIATEMEGNLKDAEVTLIGAEIEPEMSTDMGVYAFPEMPLGGSYTVIPSKDNDYKNGVSTLDLVLIQRHILNLTNLDSPYKIIAADINNDEKISASDLVQLRKLILGLTASFDNNTSWRFIDKQYNFIDELNPLGEAFPESYVIDQFNTDMQVDFVAVKVGDVNDNVETSEAGKSKAETRNNESIVLEMNDVRFNKNEEISVSLNTNEDMIITGYQFTISFDSEMIKYAGVAQNDLGFNDSNIGTQKANEGILTISFHDVKGINLGNIELLKLNFTALRNGSLSNTIAVNDLGIDAEAYNTSDEVLDIDFSVSSDNLTAGYVLYQNTPNPFSAETRINFELPKDEYVTLKIFDVQGKLVRTVSGDYNKGLNTVVIGTELLSNSGVHYYELQAGTYSSTKKMVVIK